MSEKEKELSEIKRQVIWRVVFYFILFMYFFEGKEGRRYSHKAANGDTQRR
jgi:uncharacterized membrane protein